MAISTDREFHRFTIACDDFEQALVYLEEAKGHSRGSVAHQALVSMAVVCYVRPFSPNEKSPNAQAQSSLSEKDLGPFSPPEKSLHNLCREQRNKGIAHSEFEYNPTQFSSSGQIWSEHFSIYDAEIDLGEFESLIRSRIDACHAARAPFVARSRQTVDADKEEDWLATLASLTQQ